MSTRSPGPAGDGAAAEQRKRSRLGKGLGALLGEYLPEEVDPADSGYRQVSVARITPNPYQPRRQFTEEQLAELEASVRENGLLQPLVVRPASAGAPTGAEWELVAGERRWRVVRRLGWSEVPVVVREIDDQALLVLAIVENVQRADLSPLEEAEAYRRLIDDFGYTQREVAENVGRERATVTNLLRLLRLPASVQGMLNRGELSMGHARALLGLSQPREMTEMAHRVVDEGLSVRAVEERVRRGQQEKPEKKRERDTGGAHLRHLEEELQRALGTAVRIKTGRGQTGKLEIPFYSSEDFERLTELLLGANR